MKIRTLVVLSAVFFAANGANAHMEGMGDEGMMGHHHMMMDKLFGDKKELTKAEFLKHFEDKFDAIDEEKKGTITKDQASAHFEKKMKEHKEEHRKKMSEKEDAETAKMK